MPRPSSPRPSAGFTLLELLIVLTVALLAFFLPACFSRQHQTHQGRYATCAYNEKTLGLALLQYVQDNDNLVPVGLTPQGAGWGGALSPYVKPPAIFVCPEESRQPGWVSYSLNSNLLRLKYGRKTDYSSMPSPTQTVAIFEVSGVPADVTKPDEGQSSGASVFSAAGDGVTLWTGPGGHAKTAFRRHLDVANYVFADGHVKPYPPALISVGPNAIPVSQVNLRGKSATFAVQ